MKALKVAGCSRVYLDGSFVIAKIEPADYDACWDIDGVDVTKLKPVFLDFAAGRKAQKRAYFGEFFPAQMPEGMTGRLSWISFNVTKRLAGGKGSWG